MEWQTKEAALYNLDCCWLEEVPTCISSLLLREKIFVSRSPVMGSRFVISEDFYRKYFFLVQKKIKKNKRLCYLTTLGRKKRLLHMNRFV
jgi:hypothetical protein